MGSWCGVARVVVLYPEGLLLVEDQCLGLALLPDLGHCPGEVMFSHVADDSFPGVLDGDSGYGDLSGLDRAPLYGPSGGTPQLGVTQRFSLQRHIAITQLECVVQDA